MKVAVLVVTYNRKRLLERCLNSLINQHQIPDIICVVDNNSKDGTDSLVQKYIQEYKERIIYYKLNSNRGGAGGFCYGIESLHKYEDWDWMIVMDDDAAPAPEYIEKLIESSKKHPEVKAYIGTEYVGYSNRIAYGGRRIIDKEKTMRAVLVPKENYKQSEFYVDTVTFVGLMFHRNIVNKIGYPDSSFFIYYDDSEYCLRMRPYTRILHVTSARINHREDFVKDVQMEGQQLWRRYYLYRNEVVIKKRYIKKWFYRYGWIIKNYMRKMKEIIQTSDDKFYEMYIFTRATLDVQRNRLGKAKYIEIN